MNFGLRVGVFEASGGSGTQDNVTNRAEAKEEDFFQGGSVSHVFGSLFLVQVYPKLNGLNLILI